jgi:hypothetical protein
VAADRGFHERREREGSQHRAKKFGGACDGLYSHGSKTPSKIVAQVWRQTYKLNNLLGGQFVFPVLVFMGEVRGNKAKGVPRVTLEGILGHYMKGKTC